MIRIILSLLVLCVASNSYAVGYTGKRYIDYLDDPSIDLSQHEATLYKIEKYLSSFITMEVNFRQLVSVGSQLRAGKLYISRPGNARWEYIEPIKTTLVIQDGRMSYYDEELEQISYADVPESAISVLLDQKIDLYSDKMRVLRVSETKDSIDIILTPNVKDKDNVDILHMVFSPFPMQLRRIHRVDSNNRVITLEFGPPVFNVPLDMELFSLKDPRKDKKEK